MANYSYPLSSDWSTDEIITVTKFYNAVETVYEKGMELYTFQESYNSFKKIVTSKMEEKQIDKQFVSLSGYSIYKAVKEMKALLAVAKQNDKKKYVIYLQD